MKFFVGIVTKSDYAQGLLLGLCSEITPGSIRGQYAMSQIEPE